MAGASRAAADKDAFAQAIELNERRDGCHFRWLWGCSEDVTQLDLAWAARDLGHRDAARTLFATAVDYGAAPGARELDRLSEC